MKTRSLAPRKNSLTAWPNDDPTDPDRMLCHRMEVRWREFWLGGCSTIIRDMKLTLTLTSNIICLVVWNIYCIIFHVIYGMLSFPLTNTPSFFKMGRSTTKQEKKITVNATFFSLQLGTGSRLRVLGDPTLVIRPKILRLFSHKISFGGSACILLARSPFI